MSYFGREHWTHDLFKVPVVLENSLADRFVEEGRGVVDILHTGYISYGTIVTRKLFLPFCRQGPKSRIFFI